MYSSKLILVVPIYAWMETEDTVYHFNTLTPFYQDISQQITNEKTKRLLYYNGNVYTWYGGLYIDIRLPA